MKNKDPTTQKRARRLRACRKAKPNKKTPQGLALAMKQADKLINELAEQRRVPEELWTQRVTI